MIMPGVTVGEGVVVGAGALVTRDIPSNTVAMGFPARVVRNLDEA
jgi:maltose O-acetyltransferase